MKLTRIFSLVLLFTVLASSKSFAQADLTIYLFRHAETVGEGSSRTLSEKGIERAQNLIATITEEEIDGLFSTNLNRTMQTIAPFSDKYDLDIQNYDNRTLESFADSLLTLSGTYLVSGHSNTTPELVQYLTGEEVSPIQESEYDNLFIVNAKDGEYSLTQIKYAPFSSQK